MVVRERRHPGDKVIRVMFRDDDGEKRSVSTTVYGSATKEELLDLFVRAVEQESRPTKSRRNKREHAAA